VGYILYIHTYCSDPDSGILGSVPEYDDWSGRRALLLKGKRSQQSLLLLWWSNLIYVVVNEYYKTIISKKVNTGEPLFSDCSSRYVVWVADTKTILRVGRRQTQNTGRSAVCHHISHSSLLHSPWTKKYSFTNISYVTASLNISAGMCMPAVWGVQLVVNEVQWAPGCYNIHNSFTFYGLAHGPKDISLLPFAHMYHFWDFRHTTINLSPYSIFWRLKLKWHKNAHNLHPSLSHTPRDTVILNSTNKVKKSAPLYRHWDSVHAVWRIGGVEV